MASFLTCTICMTSNLPSLQAERMLCKNWSALLPQRMRTCQNGTLRFQRPSHKRERIAMEQSPNLRRCWETSASIWMPVKQGNKSCFRKKRSSKTSSIKGSRPTRTDFLQTSRPRRFKRGLSSPNNTLAMRPGSKMSMRPAEPVSAATLTKGERAYRAVRSEGKGSRLTVRQEGKGSHLTIRGQRKQAC